MKRIKNYVNTCNDVGSIEKYKKDFDSLVGVLMQGRKRSWGSNKLKSGSFQNSDQIKIEIFDKVFTNSVDTKDNKKLISDIETTLKSLSTDIPFIEHSVDYNKDTKPFKKNLLFLKKNLNVFIDIAKEKNLPDASYSLDDQTTKINLALSLMEKWKNAITISNAEVDTLKDTLTFLVSSNLGFITSLK